MNSVDLFGYKISGGGLERDVELAINWIEERRIGHYMACANPHSLVVASRDRIFQEALRHADMLVPDGSGVVLACRLLNRPVKERVAGYDFFTRFSRLADAKGGLRYFFLGSSDQVLSSISSRLRNEFPSITVCGTYSPPFRDRFSVSENEEMARIVNNAKPDALWVGMTAPKQEKWIFENIGKLDVPFSAAIGAVFDFYAGTKIRSSVHWQNLGLEWLPRLVREPARLWKRNFVSTPIFLGWTLKAKSKEIFGRAK